MAFPVALLLLAQAGGLRIAVQNGDADAVRALLAAGATVDARGPDGAEPIHYAAAKNRADLVELLLDHGADVNVEVDAPIGRGSVPLDYAVARGFLPLCKLLIDRGADVEATYPSETTVLQIAAVFDQPAIARLLIENGAAPRTRNREGTSPLDDAAWRGFRDVAEVLVDAGADLNARHGRTGATPLNEAAFQGHEAVVELLLSRGADATIKDSAGRTPLENAVRGRHAGAARILLAHGPRGSHDDLLRQAVDRGQADVVEVLLESGASMNTAFSSGSSALREAARKGRETVIAVLLAKGAPVDQRDKSGATPLYEAALNGHAAAVKVLLAHGADINAQETDEGTTPLYAAAYLGREDVVALLLESGANPNLCNKRAVCPVKAALDGGYGRVAERIQAAGGR